MFRTTIFYCTIISLRLNLTEDGIMKITIQGYSGAGKSTLADRLGKMFGVPVLHLDSLNFTSGWVERSSEDIREDLRRFMDENADKRWVIDGNYKSKLLERRLEEADKIILLTPNRFACFMSIVKRYFQYRGSTRPSMAEGCPEKLDYAFAKWVLIDSRKTAPARFAIMEKQYPEKTLRLRTIRAIRSHDWEKEFAGKS